MLKVKSAWRGRPKTDVKDSTRTQNIDNFLFSQIKSDDMPFKVKLDDVNHKEMGKANKSVKMQTQIFFKLFGRMFMWKK